MILLLALLLLGPPRAEDRPEAERLFQLGLELVAEGDTTGALAAWDGAAATGWASTALSYNRGAVALARGDLGTARLALERAARLDPSDPTVAAALTDVRDRAGEAAASPLARVARTVLARLGLLGAVALALALYGLALALVWRWWRTRSRPFALAALASSMAFAVAVGLAVFGLAEASGERAVVVEAGVVRAAPSPTARETARLREGAVLHLGDTQGAWQAVTVGDLDGWVPSAQVEAI